MRTEYSIQLGVTNIEMYFNGQKKICYYHTYNETGWFQKQFISFHKDFDENALVFCVNLKAKGH